MQDLRLIGVHEDGSHLLLAGADGERFRVPLDESLRAAARRDRPRLGQLQIEMDGGLRPRDVQAMIRAGASAEEVAERSGWSVDKVHKYEGPILAERVHVADLARQVRVRARGGASGSSGGSGSGAAPTLSGRVAQRMRERGVDPEANAWDAWRSAEGGPWTVVLTFAAGGRQRQASWTFDLVSRTVDAGDDEARWLSEDEPTGKGPIPGSPTARTTTVYDVEAEGGVNPATTRAGSRAKDKDEPVDLMTAMRERSTVRGRRSGGRRKATPTELPGMGDAPTDALPLEELAYDAAGDELPPPAHLHPNDDPEVARAEAGAAVTEPIVTKPGETTPAEAEPAGAEPVATKPAETKPAETDSDDSVSTPTAASEVEPEATVPEATVPEATVEPDAEPALSKPEPTPRPKPAGERSKDAPASDDAPERGGARKGGRASVPSWDDIMFGARRD